jgi:septation ring formation regulator EzrA
VLILEEDKSIPVFEYHLTSLQDKLSQGEKLFPNIYSQSFEGAEAILAKVTAGKMTRLSLTLATDCISVHRSL